VSAGGGEGPEVGIIAARRSAEQSEEWGLQCEGEDGEADGESNGSGVGVTRFLMTPTPTAEEVRGIYEGIERIGLGYDAQGWNSEGWLQAEILGHVRPRVIVEVGVWKGASVLSMMRVCGKMGVRPVVYAVDVWYGRVGDMIGEILPRAIPRRWDRRTIYEQFLYNVKHEGFDDCVIPVTAFSAWGAVCLRAWGVRSDVIYVDAAHDEGNVYEDLCAYGVLLTEGGVMFGDDWSESYDGVRRAVARYGKENGQKVTVVDNQWALNVPWVERLL
jgi:Methyltransferase domain